MSDSKSDAESDHDSDAGDAMPSDELLEMLSPEAREALMAHKKAAEESAGKLTEDIGENFGMSQFWYDAETAKRLAEEAISLGGTKFTGTGNKRIACVSCPSVHKAIKDLKPEKVDCFVFEYDERFSVYGDKYVFYDFNHPHDVSKALAHSFDFVIADPPYLNENCMSLTGETMRLLAKTADTPRIFNTGAILQRPIFTVLGLRECKWRPRHGSHLSNEFCSYTNYDAKGLGGWIDDALYRGGESKADSKASGGAAAESKSASEAKADSKAAGGQAESATAAASDKVAAVSSAAPKSAASVGVGAGSDLVARLLASTSAGKQLAAATAGGAGAGAAAAKPTPQTAEAKKAKQREKRAKQKAAKAAGKS